VSGLARSVTTKGQVRRLGILYKVASLFLLGNKLILELGSGLVLPPDPKFQFQFALMNFIRNKLKTGNYAFSSLF